MAEQSLVGKEGRVTGAMSHSLMGEVLIERGGGTETYFAFAAEEGTEIPRGAQVLVIAQAPGRTVHVTTM